MFRYTQNRSNISFVIRGAAEVIKKSATTVNTCFYNYNDKLSLHYYQNMRNQTKIHSWIGTYGILRKEY